MPGKLVHFEVPAHDGERARAFWSGVFGWQFQDMGVPDLDYAMVRTGEEQGGAVYTSSSEGGRGVIVYFDTDNIDDSIARVRELGGEAEEKQPIPSAGWFARCRDTEGNAFSLFQRDESVAAH